MGHEQGGFDTYETPFAQAGTPTGRFGISPGVIVTGLKARGEAPGKRPTQISPRPVRAELFLAVAGRARQSLRAVGGLTHARPRVLKFGYPLTLAAGKGLPALPCAETTCCR